MVGTVEAKDSAKIAAGTALKIPCQRISSTVPTYFSDCDACTGTPVMRQNRIDHPMAISFVVATSTSHIIHNQLSVPPILSTCLLHTNSGCGKERRILIGSR